MELGGLDSFRYVPDWNGNMDLQPEKRLSLQVNFLRGVDLLGDMSLDDLLAWRDATFKSELEDPKLAPKIKRIKNENLLFMLFRVIENTSDYRNFVFGGEEVKDPKKIFLNLRMPSGENQSNNLLFMIAAKIAESASISEDEVENFVLRCGGEDTTTQTENAPRVLPGVSPNGVSTPADQKEDSALAPTS